jgi:16S rRNA (guanine966-N2)-methyltransferase
MRIIAGTAKGRRLTGPPGLDTRPLTDRAKEALFSSLGARILDARVLDLYAGSGSLGLEALSRGAASAVFVERDRRALDALRRNIDLVGIGGTVVASDVEVFLDRTSVGFDVVFVDPPYRIDDEATAAVMGSVAAVCAPGGLVILHRRRGGDVPATPEGLHLEGSRRYGDVELWRFIKEDR